MTWESPAPLILKFITMNSMTKQEAILAMQKGMKVTHSTFTSDEYITMKGNIIITEEGYEIFQEEFWKYRTHSNFEDNWFEWKISNSNSEIPFKDSIFELSNGTRFTIIHNIKDEVHAAFQNWIVRTKQYTAKSFCEYIKSKSPLYKAFTLEEFGELSQDELDKLFEI